MPIPLNPNTFRPKSTIDSRTNANFVITNGGIGDFLAWLPALLFLRSVNPQLIGHVFSPSYFKPLVDNFIENRLKEISLSQNSPNWQSYTMDEFRNNPLHRKARPTFAPHDQPINGMGAHLLDLGFIYFAALTPPPPEFNFYPTFDLTTVFTTLFPENTPFAIITPGATYPNRQMPSSTFNEINLHLIKNGITPVALGAPSVGTRTVHFNPDYDFSNVIDLRGKTTLLQALKIMENAKLVIGLDNGLLHLAACTTTPIIFGYNIASPEHRRPRRKKGTILDIHPDPKVLTCTFCQSKMRFMFNHDFKDCLYKDNKCLEFLADPKPWCELVDEILKQEK